MSTRAESAIHALREPDYTLTRVPNTIRQSIAEVIEDQATALERAYGILWRMPDAATGHARKLLLETMDKEGQRRGIAYALEVFGPTTEAELLVDAEPTPSIEPQLPAAHVDETGRTER